MKSTIFTITIFISFNLLSQTTETFYPIKDASIGFHDGYDSDDTNYGSATHYSAFSQPAVSGSGENTGRGIMDFDLSSIPSGASIINASLDLYAFGEGFSDDLSEGHEGDNSCYLSRITSEWNEFTITWNTQPDITSVNRVTILSSISEDEDYLDIDVTALVQDMIDEPDESYGLCLSLVDESPLRGLLFASSDFSDESKFPKLEVTYTTGNAIDSQEGEIDIKVFPNPTLDELEVNFNLNRASKISYQLYDIFGRIVFTNDLGTMNDGSNYIIISLEELNITSATYFLKVEVDNEFFYFKIMKMN